MSNPNVVVPDWHSNSNEQIFAVSSHPQIRPHTLHRSQTATSRKPLRSSPLAGPVVLSLNDPPVPPRNPSPSPDILSPPVSVHLRPKSKSAQTLARPVSLYSYSYDHSTGNPSYGHHERPSTAPGPSPETPTTSRRLSLTSSASLDIRKALVPHRPSSLLIPSVQIQESDSVTKPTDHPHFDSSGPIPEHTIAAPHGNNNGNNLALPGNGVPRPRSFGGASSRLRYSYASSSAGPSSRPVSFHIEADSDADADAETRRARRASYHPTTSTTPRPILKQPSSRSSFVQPSTPPSASSSSPTLTSPTSSFSDASSSTKPVTTRLSGLTNLDGSWYTLSPYATTPKFSRLGLAAAGVVMPISAKDMAKRNSGVSRALSQKVGHASNDMHPGKDAGRRTSMIASATASRPGISNPEVTSVPFEEKKQTPAPEWLSLPPPARGGSRSRSRSRSRSSLSSLRNASQTISLASFSLAHSSTSSAASSSSSLQSSLAGSSKDRSSTSTAASTPPSLTPSLSLRSWRSVRASLSSVTASVALQSPSKALSLSDFGSVPPSAAGSRSTPANALVSSTVMESEETVKPPSFSRSQDQEYMDDTHSQDIEKPVHPASGDMGVDRTLKKRRSASRLLARVKSWRLPGKGSAKRGVEDADVDVGVKAGKEPEGIEDGKDDEGLKEVKEVVVVAVIEVQEEMHVALAQEGMELQQVVEVEKQTGLCEDKAEVEVEGAPAPPSNPDWRERHIHDQGENDELEPEHDDYREQRGEAEHESDDGHHLVVEDGQEGQEPTSTPSVPDLLPEPQAISATSTVVPIPNPNLHVATSVPEFIQHVNADTETKILIPDEPYPILNSESKQDANDDDEQNTLQGRALVVDRPQSTIPTSHSETALNNPLMKPRTPQNSASSQVHAQMEMKTQTRKPTHKRRRSGSLRRLWNTIISSSGAGKEPVPAVPAMPSLKAWGH